MFLNLCCTRAAESLVNCIEACYQIHCLFLAFCWCVFAVIAFISCVSYPFLRHFQSPYGDITYSLTGDSLALQLFSVDPLSGVVRLTNSVLDRTETSYLVCFRRPRIVVFGMLKLKEDWIFSASRFTYNMKPGFTIENSWYRIIIDYFQTIYVLLIYSWKYSIYVRPISVKYLTVHDPLTSLKIYITSMGSHKI